MPPLIAPRSWPSPRWTPGTAGSARRGRAPRAGAAASPSAPGAAESQRSASPAAGRRRRRSTRTGSRTGRRRRSLRGRSRALSPHVAGGEGLIDARFPAPASATKAVSSGATTPAVQALARPRVDAQLEPLPRGERGGGGGDASRPPSVRAVAANGSRNGARVGSQPKPSTAMRRRPVAPAPRRRAGTPPPSRSGARGR